VTISSLPHSISRLRWRTRVAALVGGAVLLGATAAAISAAGANSDPPPATTDVIVETTTPTPIPTATPTPTPEPKGPIPAARVQPGPAAGLVNATSIGFPLPPPLEVASEENRAGIVRMVSPALGIDAPIEVVGITNGQMDSPDASSNHAVGWYPPSSQYGFAIPGRGGNAIFSAHETWGHMQAPFYLLHNAAIGDSIFLDMEDGERREYQVIRVTRYPIDSIPMEEVLWPSDRPKNEEWITLYTCGGEIIYDERGYGDYLERDVLVAVWVGSTTVPPEPTAAATTP